MTVTPCVPTSTAGSGSVPAAPGNSPAPQLPFGVTFPMGAQPLSPQQTWQGNIYMGANFNTGVSGHSASIPSTPTRPLAAPSTGTGPAGNSKTQAASPASTPTDRTGLTCSMSNPCGIGYLCAINTANNGQPNGVCQTVVGSGYLPGGTGQTTGGSYPPVGSNPYATAPANFGQPMITSYSAIASNPYSTVLGNSGQPMVTSYSAIASNPYSTVPANSGQPIVTSYSATASHPYSTVPGSSAVANVMASSSTGQPMATSHQPIVSNPYGQPLATSYPPLASNPYSTVPTVSGQSMVTSYPPIVSNPYSTFPAISASATVVPPTGYGASPVQSTVSVYSTNGYNAPAGASGAGPANGNNGFSTPVMPNSCGAPSKCGYKAAYGECWCDPKCHSSGDCCADVAQYCSSSSSPGAPSTASAAVPSPPCVQDGGQCANRCGSTSPVTVGLQSCFCDVDCPIYNDCCCSAC